VPNHDLSHSPAMNEVAGGYPVLYCGFMWLRR
jgi:hypothetical protein